jgi:hypothetical protein
VFASSGVGSVRDMPAGDDCSTVPRGSCDLSRLDSGQEYRIDVAGPQAVAIHVIDGHAASEAAPTSTAVSGTGYRGAVVTRGGSSIAVIATDKADGVAPASLTYSVPAGSGTTHVVVDAPAGNGGRSDVTGVLDGGNCKMTVTPHAGTSGGFDGHGLVVRVSNACAVTDDTAAAVKPPVTTMSTPTTPSGAGGMATTITTTTTPSAAAGGSAGTAQDGGTAEPTTGSGSGGASDGAGGASNVGGAVTSVGGTATEIDQPGSTTGTSLGNVAAAAGDSNHTGAAPANCAVRGGVSHNSPAAPAALAGLMGAIGLIRRRRARAAAKAS